MRALPVNVAVGNTDMTPTWIVRYTAVHWL